MFDLCLMDCFDVDTKLTVSDIFTARKKSGIFCTVDSHRFSRKEFVYSLVGAISHSLDIISKIIAMLDQSRKQLFGKKLLITSVVITYQGKCMPNNPKMAYEPALS